MHLVITPSSQPETKGDGPVASIDSRGLLLAPLLSSSLSLAGYRRKPRVFTQVGLEKFCLIVICFESNYFLSHALCLRRKEEYDRHKGSMQQKFSVYGGAHLTANVLKHGRNVVSFLNVIMRQL